MTILGHELRQNRSSLFIWSGSVAFLMAICIFLFPEMQGEMDEMGAMFSEMGSFTAAFGMDRLNFGEFSGFYGIECGNILGLGGAFFAALTGVSILSKEEKEHTADFLLTHPVSRKRVVAEKLGAVVVQLLLLNGIVLGVALVSMQAIGEGDAWKDLLLLHLAYFLVQLEIGAICFGLSACLRRASVGVGLGLAAAFYFLNIIANLTEKARFLKYITPFGYAESADILTDGCIQLSMLLPGLLYGAAGIAAAWVWYGRKDIR